MRGLGRRAAAAGIAVFGALTFVTLSGPAASAGVTVHGYNAQVGALKVQVYSQMCDRGGQNLHTRLAVKNTSSSEQSITVHDAMARAVYDPPGPIAPGKGMLVHLTMTRDAPEHSIQLSADGKTVSMTVPETPCNTIPDTTPTTKKPPSSTTKPTTSTSKPTTSSTITTVPPAGGPSDPGGGPVGMPGVVGVGASVGNRSAVKAAATGTLPFTGSDIRGFAVIGNLLVLIGFAMLFISHRSPRTAAFFKRLRPGSTS
jgi:hypothetical protein